MNLLCVVLGLLQGPPTDITASTDRAHLQVGEQLTLTIRVRTRVAQLGGIDVPPTDGFSVQASNEVTEVSLSGPVVIRTVTRQLVLRAERPGTFAIGPIRVRQPGVRVQTDPIPITVDSASNLPTGELSPLARAMLEAAPPPARTDRVSLTVLVPHDTVVAGDQLDVVVAAWFPHDVMTRLRRPPVLTLPGARGAWAYPQNVPNGVALSRKVRGVSFDLFAVHQVLFPLAPGQVVIPAATAEYALPISFSFFSREERYDLGSDSVIVTVMGPPPPSPGLIRPTDAGVVARDVSVGVELSPATGRVGDPLEARITIQGRGNVDLWPAPAVRWPASFRSYPGETAVTLTAEGGRIGGTKLIRTLLVPDSAGSFVIPEIRYPYYDPGTRSYRVAGVAPRSLTVAPGAEPRAARTVPPLLESRAGSLVDRIGAVLMPWGWLALLALPPLPFLLAVVRRWRGGGRHAAVSTAVGGGREHRGLARLELEFHRALSSHVPDAEARDGDALARALRATGLESAVADHVMRLRDRLRATRYGPHGVGDAAELAEEIDQVLKVLGAEPAVTRHRRVTLVGAALAAGAVLGGRLAAQRLQPPPEVLYETGALHVAADSFAARAAGDTLVAAHWYNLGATLYRAGEDGKATAAWTLAARLAPRDRVIRHARRLLPPPDAGSEPLLAVGPATPSEWWLLAALLWASSWLIAWPRRRLLLALLLTASAAAAAGAGLLEWRRRAAPVAVIVAPATPIRAAPFGAASAGATLDPGAALLITDSYAGGRWLRVWRADGIAGWVLAAQVVRL